jgi:hypothetical protein
MEKILIIMCNQFRFFHRLILNQKKVSNNIDGTEGRRIKFELCLGVMFSDIQLLS